LVSPLYLAVMLRLDPPPLPELPPPQPANAAAAIRKNAKPAYAYRFRLATNFVPSIRLSIANTAASHAKTTKGVLRGRVSIIPGGNEEIAAVKVAVQEAPALLVAPADLQVAAAVPRFELPFINCTVPVGPCVELLLDETTAVNVTLPPEAILLMLGVTPVVVVACVMVTESVLLLACDV
jgi:hypothetical protein